METEAVVPSVQRSTRSRGSIDHVQGETQEKTQLPAIALPSPLSEIFCTEIPHNPRPSPPESDSKQIQSPYQHSRSREDRLPELVAIADVKQKSDRGRKRQATQDFDRQGQDEPDRKKPRIVQPQTAQGEKRDKSSDAVTYWTETGYWPESFLKMDGSSSNASSENSKKRKRTPSYSQTVKDGENPKAYTKEYENHLRERHIFMDLWQGHGLVSDDSKSLGVRLQSSKAVPPKHASIPAEKFSILLERLRNRNEQRVYRDITPLVVPSAELLFLNGESNLEHLAEEVNADWMKCTALAGPQPRPDFAVGLMSSAFTDEEQAKLKNYTTFDRATLFTENMYFPFLMCEVKCGDQGIDRADRQNMHSCSIAVNAIIQLHREADRNSSSPCLQELNRKVLVFSVSHDHRIVRVHGHFALIANDKITFHRYLIYSTDMVLPDPENRWMVYNFIRQLYSTFAQDHLKRVRDQLGKLDNLQEFEASASMSKETTGFKIPPLPSTVGVQQENDGHNDQIDRLNVQIERLNDQMQEQEQQRVQHEERVQQEKERAQQENDKLRNQINMLLEQQQEQQRQQREQQRQQREQFEIQMEQYKEFIEILKQQKHGDK